MSYTPITPFRRPVDAGLLAHQRAASAPLPPSGVNKWEVLRELGVARVAFGLSDRDVTVLQALVSFHPTTILGENDADPVVHPSNRAICERLNGMPTSTMRRHLGNLVASGVILRRDSPNGKRYVRRAGGERIVFGFDLSPLARRNEEICAAAEEIRAAAEQLKRLRERVSLMRRDLAGLAAYGVDVRPDLAIWDAFSDLATLSARALRRKLEVGDLELLEADLSQALNSARNIIEPSGAEIMSINDHPNEQHHQNSNTKHYDSEHRLEKPQEAGVVTAASDDEEVADDTPDAKMAEDKNLPNVPLRLVTSVCQEYLNYTEQPIRHWHELVHLASTLRPMIGITLTAWDEACEHMGPEQASVVLVAMLDRLNDIRSPGGYLRALTSKAAAGAFSCGPMVMAQMRREAA
ncbi:plasmid replication protein RepC [Palleronia caenipelagi]|uniref:Replication initiation protein RepC n=1 Tax=Palleronia caenipelagi TaxID=2489174 RepID=A0A547PUG6_9RHOB|nr:plasmid replication protein RepC [Palleronia caenipelagi]TRD17790.1 replication initiation protein RepC [Palleronia caenipelagi]